MSRGPIIVHPRFWLLLMAVFLLVFTPLYVILDQEGQRLMEKRDELLEQREELSQQLQELQIELNYIRTDQGIEQYAREAGMVMPGEIRYGKGQPESNASGS